MVDEHMTLPQIRGMYQGTEPATLIDYGFRLPAAIDNNRFGLRIPTQNTADVVCIRHTG